MAVAVRGAHQILDRTYYTTVDTQFATDRLEQAAASSESWAASLHRLEALLERRSAIPGFVRERPVASLAIAFGAGLMIATGPRYPQGWIARTAYRRFGKAVAAGLTAVALAEARAWLAAPSDTPAQAARTAAPDA